MGNTRVSQGKPLRRRWATWIFVAGVFAFTGWQLRHLLDLLMPDTLLGAPLYDQLVAAASFGTMSSERRAEYRAADFATRIAIADFYADKGRMPYPDGELRVGGSATVEFHLDGNVVISTPGRGAGRILLRPRLTSDGRIEWNCKSPDLPAAPMLARDCRYAPSVTAD